MNVLMIGTGDIAYSHGRAVVKLGGRVYACYDVNEAGMKRYQAEFGSEMLRYEQLEDYIPQADYVVLCTPPTNLEDAAKIKEMEQQYDGKIIVGFAHRYRPAFQKMVELVRSGALGDPVNVFDNRVGPGYGFRGTWCAPSWRTDPRFACGFTIESISHEWNLLTALCGEFETLSANTWCTIDSLPAYDTNCAATMKIKKGGIATICASWSSDLGGTFRGYIGTRGTAFLRGRDMFEFEELTYKTMDMAEPVTIHYNDSYKHNQDGVIFPIHQHFQDCLKNGTPICTPLDEGIKVLKLSTLALESSREHKEIILDERM